MRLTVRAIALLAFTLPSSAVAGTFAEDVEATRAALAGAEVKAASVTLKAAAASAPASPEVINSKTLAQYWFYNGLATWMKTKSVDKAGDAWRQALIVDNEFQWDEELVKDRDAQDYFLALAAEVRSRPQVDPAVPAATGEARIYVDGIRVRAGDLALEGDHVAQIRCPDLAVFGEWSDFSKPIKYFKMCPAGVDTSIVVEEVEEDDFGDVGPAFGGPPGDDAPAGPPPDPEQDVVDTIARGAGLVEDAGGGEVDVSTGSGETGGESEVQRKKVIWPAFVAGVVSAGAAGAFQYIALQQNADYNDLESKEYETAGDLADLRKKTNRNQSLVYPLLGVSGGLLFVATYQW